MVAHPQVSRLLLREISEVEVTHIFEELARDSRSSDLDSPWTLPHHRILKANARVSLLFYPGLDQLSLLCPC